MKPEGWFFLIVSWSFITGLCIFCLQRVFHQHQRRSKAK